MSMMKVHCFPTIDLCKNRGKVLLQLLQLPSKAICEHREFGLIAQYLPPTSFLAKFRSTKYKCHEVNQLLNFYVVVLSCKWRMKSSQPVDKYYNQVTKPKWLHLLFVVVVSCKDCKNRTIFVTHTLFYNALNWTLCSSLCRYPWMLYLSLNFCTHLMEWLTSNFSLLVSGVFNQSLEIVLDPLILKTDNGNKGKGP